MPRDYYSAEHKSKSGKGHASFNRSSTGQSQRGIDPEFDARNYGNTNMQSSSSMYRDKYGAYAETRSRDGHRQAQPQGRDEYYSEYKDRDPREKEDRGVREYRDDRSERDYYDGDRSYMDNHSGSYEKVKKSKRKSKHKRKHSKDREERKHKSKIKALVDYADDSSESLEYSSPAIRGRETPDAERRTYVKSPAAAITEYKRRHRERSASPIMLEAVSPARTSKSARKNLRTNSPESVQTRVTKPISDAPKAYVEPPKAYRNSSPSHSPSPKKSKYTSSPSSFSRGRSPSPQSR